MSKPKLTSIPSRKGDIAEIKIGDYQCVIDKYRTVVNPSYPIWSKEGIKDYIKFLEQVLEHI